MKKLMFLMMALLVAPAMAAVEITVVKVPGECAVDIFIESTGTDAVGAYSQVAGVALDVVVAPGTTIDDVTNFMTTGVSTSAAPGWGIYMGNIKFTGDPVDAIDLADPDYDPVAPFDAPDGPGQLGSSAIVLEFGALYDVGIPADAPPALPALLCTVHLSGDTTVTVTEEIITRGGIVLIGGGPPSSTILPAADFVVTCACYTGPDDVEWGIVGEPLSWCYPRQCHGDADGLQEVIIKGTYWVGINDISILLAGFKQGYSGSELVDGPDADSAPDTWIAADFDHASEVIIKGTYRVGINDISILLGSFKNDAGAPADCNP